VIDYFAYGSNMDPDQMHRHVALADPLGPARLDGYRIAFSLYPTGWGGGVANLEPDPAGHVWGLLWAMPDDGLEPLDTYEGHPTFYRREELEVTGPDGPVTAWTYRVAHQTGYVRPTDEYVAVVEAGMRRLGLPAEAFEQLDRAARPPNPTIAI
jgi:gamma-glutamylcyclotransferase